MAIGPITGYEPGPSPGTYDFTRSDGGRMRLFGAPAEELRKRLDASAALAPQPVAGTRGAPMGAPPPAEAPPEPAQPNILTRAVTGLKEAFTPSAPAGPPPESAAAEPAPARPQRLETPQDLAAAGYQPLQRNKDGSSVWVLPGADPNSPGAQYTYEPARAGSKGGIRETTSSVVQQGGFTPSEEYKQAKEEIYQTETKALEIGRKAAEMDAAIDAGYASETEKQQALRRAELEAETKDKAEKLAVMDAQYQKAEADFQKAKVDPRGGLGIVGGGLAAIAQALGAYGATLGGTPNFAQQIIESAIQRNIRAQETALNVKRDTRNQLSELKEKLGGSLDLAKSALYNINLKRLETHYRTQAAQSKDKQAEAQNLASAAAVRDKYVEGMEAYRRQAEGLITKQKNFANVPGSAGSPGGVRLPTAQERTDAGAGKASGAPHVRQVSAETSDKISGFATGLDTIAKLSGMLKRAKVGPQGEELDDPTTGPLDWANFKGKNTLNEQTRRLAMSYQKARGKSDADARLAAEDAVGSGSVASRNRSLDIAADEFARGLKTTLSGLPPEQATKMLQSLSPEAREMYFRLTDEERQQ